MANQEVPKSCRVVIIGGGVIGCSIAYHLGHLGWSDVVLIERDQLTSGTTWHAAGLMTTFGSTSETSVEMRMYTRDLYGRLEAETGLSTGFEPLGFIELAADSDRVEEYRRVAAFNRMCGNDVEEIGPDEIKKLFPLARVDDIEAGFYLRQDGRVNPVDATMALAKGARQKGVTIVEGVSVTGVTTRNGRATGVTTTQGNIQAEFVVNCAGMWARQLGALNGVTIPNQSTEHYYLITEPIEGMTRQLPIIEDPSCHGYYREEGGGGLMIGLFEPVCAPWKVDGVPDDFSFGEIEPDWDRMTPFLEKAMSRIPVSPEAGLVKFFCGPESFTPDMGVAFGEAPEIQNYFVAAGLNSIGIITGGGLGRIMAQWITTGDPGADITGINVDRFHPYQCNPEYRKTRVVETLGLVYRRHYPTRVPQTARDCKRSPFHDRLKDQRAYFTDVSGWESPAWYAPEGKEPKVEKLSWGRQNWFPYWEAEHKACREGVIAMDMSFMGKFLVQGRDAGKVLDHISANSVNGPVETITYTQFLNERGKLEADVTVTKQTEERFIVVVTDTMHRHVETWIRAPHPRRRALLCHRHHGRHRPAQRARPQIARAAAVHHLGGFVQRGLPLPHRARDRHRIRTAAVYPHHLRWRARLRAVHPLGAGRARLRPRGRGGQELRPAPRRPEGPGQPAHGEGLSRLRSRHRQHRRCLRDRSRIRRRSGQAGLLGKAYCVEKKAQGPAYDRRLLQVLVKDPEPLLYHAEVVYRNNKAVGYVRAASYGFTLGGAVGLAMIEAGEPINKAYLEEGEWEIDIAGKRYPAEVSLRPMYDPKMEKVRC